MELTKKRIFSIKAFITTIISFVAWFWRRGPSQDVINDEKIHLLSNSNIDMLYKGNWLIVTNEVQAKDAKKTARGSKIALLEVYDIPTATAAAKLQLQKSTEILRCENGVIVGDKVSRPIRKDVPIADVIDYYTYFTIKSVQKKVCSLTTVGENLDQYVYTMIDLITSHCF